MTTSQNQVLELEISGMTCAACANRIEKKLRKLDGVTATVNYATARAHVTGIEYPEAAIAAVEKAGYGAHIREGDDDVWSQRSTENQITSLRRRLITAAALAIPLMDVTIVLALVPEWRFPGWEIVCLLLALPIVTWCAWPFHRATWRNLRHGAVSMDTLVSLGITASFGWAMATLLFGLGEASDHGFWLGFGATPQGANSIYLDVAAGMTTFQLAGRYFETRSRRKASDVLGALQALAPATARVLREGVERIIPIAGLEVGETFVVLPGETIATDGVITQGRAAVDVSMLTGEPAPVALGPGDAVTGGTIATDNRLEVEATAVGVHTQLAQMAALTQDAQARKSQVQRLVDRIITWFVPVVIGLAVATTVGWLIAGAPLQQAYGIGIAVLIIACPCALGLATPTALMVGIGRGASLGILIKGHDALEASGAVGTVVLDKTGTLTSGVMQVSQIYALGIDDDDVLGLAAAVERGAQHQIARAVVAAADDRELPQLTGTDFESLAGLGAAASVEGSAITVGNAALMAERSIELDEPARRFGQAAAARGDSVAYVARNSELVGALAFSDTPKPGAKSAVDALRQMGLRTVLLTGDSRAAGQWVGSQLGVDEVIAEVLPQEKAAAIEALQAKGETVAMVGDGVNDSIALATADLGIGVVTGTDVALKATDVILVRDDLMAIPDAVGLSRRTLRTIRNNLLWAFGYNVAAIPVAMAGFLNPLIAAAAMSLSSVLVVQNSLRLANFRGSRAADIEPEEL